MQRRDIPLWLVLPPLLGVTAVVSSPAPSRLYAALLSTGAYSLIQVLLPECRFTRDRYLCPLNWAMLLFLVKLVVVPALVMLDRPWPGVLPFLPERASMECALAVETVAFVSFCLAIRFVPARTSRCGFFTSGAALVEATPSLGMAAVFAGLGVLGFAATFGSIGNLVEYFTNPAILTARILEIEGSWQALGSTVLRPFLAFSLILLWCRGVDLYAPRSGRILQMLATAAVACGIVLANLTFSFNRGAFVFPLVTLTAVFVYKVNRMSPMLVAALAAIVAGPILMIGTYRSSAAPGEVFRDGSALSSRGYSEQLQIYACGPQFLGYLIEEAGWGKPLYWGSTLVASALGPVPSLGKGFRDSSGVAIYNRAIYGNTGVADQIIPFQGELFLNFHLPGIVAGFFGLGLLIGQCQRQFESARSAFAAFAIHYVSMWAAMLVIWSLAVFSQIMVYFCWPIYLYVGWNWIGRWAKNQYNKPVVLSVRSSLSHGPADGLS